MATHEDEEARRAANEATFREANENIRDAERELQPPLERVPFLCECDDVNCREPVQLATEEYERIRSDGTLFAVVSGHATNSQIVEQHDGYVVVRKTGIEGAVARALDPREEDA